VNINDIHSVYFIGAGGIGMSALARYFNANGKNVWGYDRTPSDLTDDLIKEGINIHFEDSIDNIPVGFLDKTKKDNSIVVYTPAVRDTSKELIYLKENSYRIYKRAEILGHIVNSKVGLAVAGTHGKTTISTCLSHILRNSKKGCSAFLGGISKNYNTNLLISGKSELVVVEADEFDRSFLHLKPFMAVITAIDADHLDIYGDYNSLNDSFEEFIGGIRKGGILISKKGILDRKKIPGWVYHFNYSLNGPSDYYADNLKLNNEEYIFNLATPRGKIENLRQKLPGLINVENAVAACAMAHLAGTTEDEIRDSLKNFTGIKRRFDVRYMNKNYVYIDDYAHHPEEIHAVNLSVRELYPGKKITAIFQPHLYSRTRDFADQFADKLDHFDNILLLDLYPAREEQIPGISSEIIFNRMSLKSKTLCNMEDVIDIISKNPPSVLITMGAGSIGQLAEPITKLYEHLEKDA